MDAADRKAEEATRHYSDPAKKARVAKFLAEFERNISAITPQDEDNVWKNDSYDHVPERHIEDMDIAEQHRIADLRAANIIEENDDEAMEEVTVGAEPINQKGKYGYTPLHEAVVAGDEGLVRDLLSKGADRHITDNGGRTPYEKALQHQLYELARLLKE